MKFRILTGIPSRQHGKVVAFATAPVSVGSLSLIHQILNKTSLAATILAHSPAIEDCLGKPPIDGNPNRGSITIDVPMPMDFFKKEFRLIFSKVWR